MNYHCPLYFCNSQNSMKQGPLVGRVIDSHDVNILIPATCEYPTLHGKRDFAGVMKALETGISSWIIRVCPMQLQESSSEGGKMVKFVRRKK